MENWIYITLTQQNDLKFYLFMTYLVSLNNLSSLNILGLYQSSNVFTVTFLFYFWMIKNTMILLLLWAANFQPFQCIPVNSSFSFRFLASTACAVISSSEEVLIQATNLKWLRYHGFLNMGEEVSEFQSQIKPMNSVMTVHHNDNFITILVDTGAWSLLITFLMSHPQPYTEINHICTIIAQHWSNFDRIFFPYDETVSLNNAFCFCMHKYSNCTCLELTF